MKSMATEGVTTTTTVTSTAGKIPNRQRPVELANRAGQVEPVGPAEPVVKGGIN